MSVPLLPVSEDSTHDVSTPKVQELILHPHQIEHFDRVINILSKFYFYQDASKQGTGKTFIATKAAIQLALPVIVICPLTIRHIWQEVLTTYGVEIKDIPDTGGIFTYDILRSKKGAQPRHELLVRSEQSDGVKFLPTPKLIELLKSGVMIIFDESQKIKNNSAQNKAVQAILECLYTLGGTSRIAFLSGTPIDKEIQVIHFLRRVRFLKAPKLYSKVRGSLRLEGVAEIQRWARVINKNKANEFISNNLFASTPKGASNYIYKLFVQVIKPGIMSIMPNPLDSRKNIKNGYYYMTPEDELEYRRNIDRLSTATRYRPGTDFIIIEKDNMGAITLALVGIQRSKVNTLIRVVKKNLGEVIYDKQGNRSYNKIIIYASYYDVINPLLEGLEEYNPVEITGRVPEQKRINNIHLFQQPNTQVRLLIGNPLAGGLGINLHDEVGLFPRIMYILPDYRINELIQASDRTTRPGMVGQSYVRFFYGHGGATETSIISALNRKGSVMREVTIEQTRSGALFPDQFEDEYESLPDNYIQLPQNLNEIPTNYYRLDTKPKSLSSNPFPLPTISSSQNNLEVYIPDN